MKKISAHLAEAGLEAMLVIGRANLFYCFGFEADEGDGAGIISTKGNWYFTDGRYAAAARETIQDATVIEIPKYSSYLRRIGNILHANGFQKIGYEERMPLCDFQACQRYLWGDLIPAERMIQQARMVKEPEEIRCLQKAQDISDHAFLETIRELHVGMTEREVAARLQCHLLMSGADEIAFPPMVQSGPNGSRPHLRPTDRKIQYGEFVTLDFGCIKDHYCSDTCRTVAVGTVSEEMKNLYQAVLEAQDAGIAKARSGEMLAASDAAARETLRQWEVDAEYDHAFGHGIGLEPQEEPVSGIGISGKFVEGLVMTAEPGVYIKDRMGVRIEDIFAIANGSGKRLSQLSRSLMIV